MAKKKRTIINPNAISKAEQEFIEKGTEETPKVAPKRKVEKSKSKSRNISATDEQWEIINEYLSKHPHEGKRSPFIMRVVLKYIIEQEG